MPVQENVPKPNTSTFDGLNFGVTSNIRDILLFDIIFSFEMFANVAR